jgi:hypothetical protein
VPTIRDAIRARGGAISALTSLIGTTPVRLAPVIVPEKWPLPAIAYQVISDVREECMGASAGLRHARVQFTILATDFPSAVAVSEALDTTFSRWRGSGAGVVVQDTFIESTADGLDPETGQESGEGTATITKDILFHYEAA